MKLAVHDFLGKFMFFLEWAKWAQIGSRIVFELLFTGRNLKGFKRFYYALFSCANPIFGKILVLKL